MTGWSKDGEGGFGDKGGEKKAEALKGEAPKEAPKPAPPEAKKEPVKPSGWKEKTKQGQKAWSEGSRADDPEKRKVLAPHKPGVGDGKVFHFLFGLKIHSPNDRRLFGEAREHINDDVEMLRNVGYTVVVDEQAVHDDFTSAIYGTAEDAPGLAPAGVFWLAHGHDDGAIETCDGGVVQPTDLDTAKVHAGLRLVVFAACYTGSCSRTWRKALGGKPMVVGWGRPVTIDRAVEFLTPDENTETDLDDLIRRYMLVETPVPAEVEVRHSPLAAAASAGRTGDLPSRLEGVISILHAKKIKEDDTGVLVDVPIGSEAVPPRKDAPKDAPPPKPRRRWHRAKLFIVDGSEPFAEGELLLGVECDVGELSSVVDLPMLLSGIEANRYSRVMLVKSEKEMPRIVTQGFMPLSRVRDMDIASLTFQTCAYADTLEKRIFGGDAA
ncbi:MAG: hypothetical protein AAGE52_20030 [Myxococcota bacterium]